MKIKLKWKHLVDQLMVDHGSFDEGQKLVELDAELHPEKRCLVVTVLPMEARVYYFDLLRASRKEREELERRHMSGGFK